MSSPTPQLKSINSSALSFLDGPTLTRIRDMGLNCSFIFEGSLFRVQNSKLVKTFLSRSKRLLISWLQSPSAVILEPPKIKEIQPVHPKGDQSQVFIGRTDAEAETPILWTPHVKS